MTLPSNQKFQEEDNDHVPHESKQTQTSDDEPEYDAHEVNKPSVTGLPELGDDSCSYKNDCLTFLEHLNQSENMLTDIGTVLYI